MRIATLSFLLLSLALVARAAEPTVGSLHLGMTLEEAVRALGPDFKQGKGLKSSDPQGMVIVTFLRGETEEVLLQLVYNKVFLINRAQLFPPGSQPNTADTYDRLKLKYGPGSHSVGSELSWAWDASGALSANQKCDIGLQLRDRPGTQSPNNRSMQGIAPSYYTNFGDCHVGLWAHPIALSDNQSILHGLVVVLEDQQPIYEYMQNQKNKAAQQKKTQDDKAKDNKAPL